MKQLRNKITGEIREFVYIKSEYGTNYMLAVKDGKNTNELFAYDSLAQLNEEWEDAINWQEIQESILRPKEPLIKDEKLCKCVKLWAYLAGASEEDKVLYHIVGTKKEFEYYGNCLRFGSWDVYIANIEDNTYYTIAELCGEEE